MIAKDFYKKENKDKIVLSDAIVMLENYLNSNRKKEVFREIKAIKSSNTDFFVK